MKPGKSLLAVLPLCMLCFAGVTKAIPQSDAESVVRTATEAIYEAIQAQCAQIENDPLQLHRMVEEILIPHADFKRMAQLALGKHWKTEPAELRPTFTAEFRHLLIRTYATAVQMASLEAIHYLPLRPANKPDRTVIRTEVKRPGEPVVAINYHLYKTADGWLVYDILVDGVSLVNNYRATFSEEIRTHGLAGLIETLRKKNTSSMLDANAKLVKKRAARACR